MYLIIRPLLFTLPPETAHRWSMCSLLALSKLGFGRSARSATAAQPVTLMGLTFPNRIGLAAGFDKNAEYIDVLARFGFGFIEVGTVTPRPQPGNPKPRLFRLPKAQALINRMGFNNQGVDYLLAQLRKSQYKGILGINIGKNIDTPVEQALQDYAFCLERVYPYASYVTINISSPNTPGLRQLQYGEALNELLSALKKMQAELAERYGKYVPLLVKIAPDLSREEVKNMAQIILQQQMDGVIATNTTISRTNLPAQPHSDETGGLSGKPLFAQALTIVQALSEELQGKIPVIAVGGIMSVADAQLMIQAGASLVQIYTGWVYHGPKLITDLASIVR